MTTTIQPPTVEQPGRPRRRFGVVPALGILAAGGLVLAIINGQRQHNPADDSTQRDTVRTASGAVVEASTTCDAGTSLVQVRVTGLTEAADTTVRIAADLDTVTRHSADLDDGLTQSTRLDADGTGGVDLTSIAPGPATVRLYQPAKGVTALAHVTVPICK